MLLRRVIEHVKAQNWTAVALDFFIVVLGVFIGIQVSNWNGARADERAYQNAMMRFAEESFDDLDTIAEDTPAIEGRIAKVQAAIVVLETCATGAASEATLNAGLNIIRGYSYPEATTLALDQLVSDDKLLARQNTTMRTILRDYHAQLHSMNDTASLVSGTLSPQENDRHPLIGFTGVLDPSESLNGVDIRRARINAPLDVVCEDDSFAKQFYAWERAQVYQLSLNRQTEQAISDTLKTLKLTRPAPKSRESE